MRGANTFVISIRHRLFSDVSARTESEMDTVIVPDDGLVILNGPRVKVRSYSKIAMPDFMVQLWSSNCF